MRPARGGQAPGNSPAFVWAAWKCVPGAPHPPRKGVHNGTDIKHASRYSGIYTEIC